MTLLSFAKEMLGEELDSLGMKRVKGPRWIKLIDDRICIMLWLEEIPGSHGYVLIRCSIESLFYRHNDFDAVEVNRIYALQSEINNGQGSALHLDAERTEYFYRVGRKMFQLIKPVIESVHDINSCYSAANMLNYLEFGKYYSIVWGHEASVDECVSFRPEHPFFMLCSIGRYDDAADYVRRENDYYQRKFGDHDLGPRLIQQYKALTQPLIDLVENSEFERIRDMLRENYISSCNELENLYRLKVDRARVLSELE